MQITVTAATTCAAVWLARYSDIKHTFTVATVGIVTIAAYTISCAFLTMHEQVSELCQLVETFPPPMLLAATITDHTVTATALDLMLVMHPTCSCPR